MTNAVNIAKKVVDVTGLLAKGEAFVLSKLEMQHKNQFEVIFFPDTSGDWKSNLKASAFALLDTVIVSLYVQSVVVTFSSIEYERADNIQYIKDIEYPESIKMTFYEDDLGVVRTYLNVWMKNIANVDTDGKFVFNDDQIYSKKNATLTPLMKTGLPSGAWVGFKGLKIKNIGDITFDQSSPEQMLIDVDFACDHCWWKTLI